MQTTISIHQIACTFFYSFLMACLYPLRSNSSLLSAVFSLLRLVSLNQHSGQYFFFLLLFSVGEKRLIKQLSLFINVLCTIYSQPWATAVYTQPHTKKDIKNRSADREGQQDLRLYSREFTLLPALISERVFKWEKCRK
jgi:hypothetical protein